MQEFDWKVIIFSLMITVFFYGLFPLLFAGLRKKPVKRKAFRVICFVVNFFVMILFKVIYDNSITAPYLLWTTIFSGVGISILENRGLAIEKQETVKTESTRKSKKQSNTDAEILVKTLMDMYAQRETVYYCQQPNDPVFGYSLKNPISTCGIDGSKEYLVRLRTKDNQPFTWERLGSFSHPVAPVMVDKYRLFLNGQEDKALYICPYGYSSVYAPAGLYLLPSLDGAKEIVEANLDKTEFGKRLSAETADFIKLCEKQARWKQLKFISKLNPDDNEIKKRAEAGGVTAQDYLFLCKMQIENYELYFEKYNRDHGTNIRLPEL